MTSATLGESYRKQSDAAFKPPKAPGILSGPLRVVDGFPEEESHDDFV